MVYSYLFILERVSTSLLHSSIYAFIRVMLIWVSFSSFYMLFRLESLILLHSSLCCLSLSCFYEFIKFKFLQVYYIQVSSIYCFQISKSITFKSLAFIKLKFLWIYYIQVHMCLSLSSFYMLFRFKLLCVYNIQVSAYLSNWST